MQLSDLTAITERGPELLPLDAGEQYRFGFSMDACIGCHSCEVACAEQNGNPVDVNWRRVGEIEGGQFPDTRRLHLSMGCNHCLDPSCLTGCPTNAYVKLDNGIVDHLADECIGCGYCTWNCPYGVPVFDPVRKIVTKCDLCRPRLDANELPACVLACPTEAITLEKVNVDEWRADHAAADLPNLPPADQTISTTRIGRPADLPVETFAASDYDLRPEEPHWPLIVLTLLTQLSLGAVTTTVVLEAALALSPARSLGPGPIGRGATAAFLAGALALGAALFHLGRPASAWKAVRNLRRSWLSREVLLFFVFSAASVAYAASGPGAGRGWAAGWSAFFGCLAVAAGGAGVYASARLYLVPARPAWNSRRTIWAFFLTAAASGPLFTLVFLGGSRIASGALTALVGAAAAGVAGQLAVHAIHVIRLARRSDIESRGAVELLAHRFGNLFALRLTCAAAALGLLAWLALTPDVPATWPVLLALAAVGAGELLGRYLFFVTVVPMDMPGSYFRGRR